MARLIASLIALAGISGSGFGISALIGDTGDHGRGETARLVAIQEQYLADQGTDIDLLAALMREHFGLPATELGTASEDCTLAQLETDDLAKAALPADPEAALESLVRDLGSSGPADIQATIKFLGRTGGEIKWSPEAVNKRSSIAVQTTKNLYVGSEWLSVALANPAAVHANIQHEIGGHLFYGTAFTCRLIDHAIVPGDEVDRQALLNRYAFAESEIYAELKELPFASEESIGDEPVENVTELIDHIRNVYPTQVAELVLSSVAHRFRFDETIQPVALRTFLDLLGQDSNPA